MFRLLVLSVFFSWINLRLLCHLSIWYLRNVIISGDIFKIFRTSKSSKYLSCGILSKKILLSIQHILRFFLFRSTFLHDHLIYKFIFAAECIFAFLLFYGKAVRVFYKLTIFSFRVDVILYVIVRHTIIITTTMIIARL